MSEPNLAGATAAPSPHNDPNAIIFGSKAGVTLLNHDELTVIKRLPLPGIMIFVHGVNSDGEWYKATEEGLCTGLSERLMRCEEHMAHPTPEGGQLTPATYAAELTDDGFISPEMKADTFMRDDDHFTPVIQFRWGYKANAEELQEYGTSIYLNEQGYWGGGPFANGCSALPDLWGKGLSDSLFLWMHIQHLNPTNDRNVYSCPPRSYYVLAALRLATLVKSLREKQADVPITIVCHSQGNMIGIAAAFLGDRMAPAVDSLGVEGRCVADNYVLSNAPYSLKSDNFTEDWTEGHMKDKDGGTGRQTVAARIATMRAFFDIIRQPTSREQNDKDIDSEMANVNHGFKIADDRERYGYGDVRSTLRRVTLYCNPHDQVISATTVQGIGWCGLSALEIKATGGAGLFCQRVYAQGFEVGEKGEYHYWANHYRQPAPGSDGYWSPPSQIAAYSLAKGLEAQRGKFWGKVFTVGTAPFMIVAMKLAGTRINAMPHREWSIPLKAPNLPKKFAPQSRRFGVDSEQFDQGYDAPGQNRNSKNTSTARGSYGINTPIQSKPGENREKSDAAQGDAASEAAQRYEDHARLRMQAKREGMASKENPKTAEDSLDMAGDDYLAWRDKQIKTYLAANIDTHATDHSTIMTNGMHARRALAYDVAIGLCQIRDEDLHNLRKAADWRFLKGLEEDDPHKQFEEYFLKGKLKKMSVSEWADETGSKGGMPDKIIDRREHSAPREDSSHGAQT